MGRVDLSKYGITGTTEIVHNPSFEVLFEEETRPELEGFDRYDPENKKGRLHLSAVSFQIPALLYIHIFWQKNKIFRDIKKDVPVRAGGFLSDKVLILSGDDV